MFRRLPVEFRNIYDNLRDIHSANMLYKYSYEAFTDGQKLQKAIESGSTEFGMTSSGKAICRVNDYLHFLLGNGIIADVFSEYRSAVKNLMSLLVYKYSTQGKKVLHEQPFPFIDGNDVYFDEIDFHCFIEYFDAKEIIALLSKYHIETIEFQNMASIENAVNNLLDYYSYLKQRIDAAKNKNNNGVVVYPTKQPYEELDQVGYWCLLNVLKAKDFQEFLGNSEAFDFYCEYAKFDFSRFDVSWLLNLYPHTLEQIAKNAKVKERVRVAIATTLDGEAIAPSDSQRLQSILVKHFC